MHPRFREDKVTQAACILLQRRGGTMSYLKLIKLLYLADRIALLEWGRPISFDRYFSMRHGPVLSDVLNLIDDGPRPGTSSYWHSFITVPANHEIGLISGGGCPSDALSAAEREVLNRVFDGFGRMTRWELVDWMHEHLPEWQDPDRSAVRISYEDILRAGGKTDSEAAAIEDELESLALADTVFG